MQNDRTIPGKTKIIPIPRAVGGFAASLVLFRECRVAVARGRIHLFDPGVGFRESEVSGGGRKDLEHGFQCLHGFTRPPGPQKDPASGIQK